MKNPVTIAFIVAAACIVVGAVAVFAVLGAGGFEVDKVVVESVETRAEEITDKFDSIMIYESEADIEIVPATDGTARVEYPVVENRNYIISVDNGVLDIRLDDRREWYTNFNVMYKSMSLRVYVPRTEYETLFVNNSSGKVTIPENFTFVNLEIDASSGNINSAATVTGEIKVYASSGSVNVCNVMAKTAFIENTSGSIIFADSEINEASVDNTSGKVSVSNVKAAKVTVKNTSGGISITDCEFKESSVSNSSGSQIVSGCVFGSVDVCGTSGSIEFINCTADTLRAGNSSGSITVDGTVADTLIEIENSSGGVRFNNADAGEIRVKCTSGGVRGNLLTGKIFDVRTASGSEDVPASDREGGLCTIETTSGSVKITVG